MNNSKRNIAANYLGSAWAVLMNIAFVPWYVKLLGIEAYGLVGVFTVLQTCMTLLDGGLTPTLSRELALLQAGTRTAQAIRDLVFTSEVLYVLVMLAVAAALAVAAPMLAVDWIHVDKLPVPSVIGALRVMGMVLGLRWLSSLYKGAYIGLQRQVWLAACTSIFATLRGMGAIAVLIWISPTIKTFFVYQGIVAMLEAVTLGVNLKSILARAPRLARFSTRRLIDIWRFAAGVTVLTLLGILLTQFDKVLLSKLLPLATFGYYVIASTVAGSLYLLVTPIANVSYPQFTALVAQTNDADLIEAYHKFSQFTSIVVMPVSLILIVFAKPIIYIWSRNPAMTAAVAPLVSVLAFGNMLHGIMHTPYMLQLAHGWTRFGVMVNSAAIVLLLPAIYFSARFYGALGAASVWVVLNLAYVLIATPLMHKRLLRSEMWRWYREDVMLPLAGAAAGIFVILLLVPGTFGGQVAAKMAVIGVATGFSLVAAVAATPLGRMQVGQLLKRSSHERD